MDKVLFSDFILEDARIRCIGDLNLQSAHFIFPNLDFYIYLCIPIFKGICVNLWAVLNNLIL